MNFIRKLETKDLEDLKENGVIVLNEFIKSNSLKQINLEVKSWLNKVTFNNNLSTSVIGNNQWISHIGLCSKTSLDIALDLNLIDFIENYFGEDIILGECSFQKKILPEKKTIDWHSDREGGIYVFVFLNDININTGATTFIKKSHINKESENESYKVGDGPTYISKSVIENYINDSIESFGGPGTIVIFNQNIWHKLPAFKLPGREVIWFKYFPSKKRDYAVDHLYRQSLLTNLNEKQLKVFCIDGKKNLKKGITQLGSEDLVSDKIQISNLRMFLYYIRYILLSFFRKNNN